MTSRDDSALAGLVADWSTRRGRPAILYRSDITEDTIPLVYRCLRKLGQTDALDLILVTTGGSVSIARQLVHLLRGHTRHLSVVVPYHARSAGTLVCLGADELVLGPLSGLGPIDAQVGADRPPAPGQPGSISAEDVRLFSTMAREWFGVDRPEDRLQVLALVAQRIFPTTLSSTFRFDRLVREVAHELLSGPLGGPDQAEQRSRIVTQLVENQHAHDSVLLRHDVTRLGLPVAISDRADDDLLWALAEQAEVFPLGERGPSTYLAVIATEGVFARSVVEPARSADGEDATDGLGRSGWQIFEEDS